MRQKSSSGKWRSHQKVASGGKGSKGSGGKELKKNYQLMAIPFIESFV